MVVGVKSELDSRILIYPLIRAMKAFGTICVISTNPALNRLVDSEDEGGFRNVRIIVEQEGATDDILHEYGIKDGDFDFIILDNMGLLNYDVLFVPVGIAHSEVFDEDVKMLMREDTERVFVVQFGSKPKAKKKEKGRNSSKLVESEGVSEESDLSEGNVPSKFRSANSEEKKHEIAVVPFPSYGDIEQVEASHIFYNLPESLIPCVYEAIKDVIAIDLMNFKKEVRLKDESSGYIQSVNTLWEE